MDGLEIGKAVVFTDSLGQDHLALVTTTFGEKGCNLVYVSEDATRTDTYGRQLERATSVLHQSIQPAAGMFWRFVTEEKRAAAYPQGSATTAARAG